MSAADATMGDTTPNQALTPRAEGATDSSDRWSLPLPHQLPLQPHYAQHHTLLPAISHHGTTTHHPVPDNADTATPQQHTHTLRATLRSIQLEEYQLLSLQQSTPLGQLDFTRPLQCIPGDLRMPHYDSALLSISLAEACNVHYYHTTSLHTTTNHKDSYIVVKLHVEQELLLRYRTSGQFIHFTRDYISYMFSIRTANYLPISQHPQLIYKVDCDLGRFTEIYSLKNNYIWNYHMPLFLPDLLHYLNNHEQLQDFQHKAIATMLCKSIHYYGFTLLTMTNLTAQQRLQLHHFLRNYHHQVAPPEVDDNRLRGAPNFNEHFVINYYASLDQQVEQVRNYRLQHWGLHV